MKLIDESVDLMRQYHPLGEKYYWVLYYTYMSAYKPMNITEIISKLDPIYLKEYRLTRSTYFRWQESAPRPWKVYCGGMRRRAETCWNISEILG